MKRFACLVALMALSSPACARDSYSFTYHGRDIHIEASRHCRSLSCVSVSVDKHDRDEDDVAAVRNPVPAPSPIPHQAVPQQTLPPATRAQAVAPALTVPPLPQVLPQVLPSPLPQVQPSPLPAPTLASAPPPPAVEQTARPQDKPQEKPIAVESPAPIARVSQQTESAPADSPLGDWQTEGKNGPVRIESCGNALCGYVLDAVTHARGESVLVNMKPKNDSEWTGNIYSRSSGNSYYGRMMLKDPNLLRVEACALGHFFCAGNNWTRLKEPVSQDELLTSHQVLPSAHS
jgi:uncharacterized protein (DUF2147 family)